MGKDAALQPTGRPAVEEQTFTPSLRGKFNRSSRSSDHGSNGGLSLPRHNEQHYFVKNQKIETKKQLEYVNNPGMDNIYKKTEEFLKEIGIQDNQLHKAAASCVLIMSEAGSPEIEKDALAAAYAVSTSAMDTKEKPESLLHRALSTERLLRTFEVQKKEFMVARASDADALSMAGRLVGTYDRLRKGNASIAEIAHDDAIQEARRIRSAYHRHPKP